MFQRILVATDFSEVGQRMVDEAIEIAKLYRAKLMLLHVLSTEEESYPPYSLYPVMEYYSEFSEKALLEYENRIKAHQNRCLEKLETFKDQAIRQGLEAEILQRRGGAGHCVCETAEEWKADLILLGNRGRKGLTEMFLGSVSNYVMHHAFCSVLILRPQPLQEARTEDQSESVEIATT